MLREGEYDSKRIPITGDVFDITGRLKSIDKSYFVVYNKASGKYEVHREGQAHNTLAFIVPYNGLDARTIILARETSIEYIDDRIKEIDEHNEKLIKDSEKNAKYEAVLKAKDVYKFLNR